jgi:hypothetical protein
VMGFVHCGIYKGLWNVSTISYLSSTTPPFPFTLPHHDTWNSFNGYIFHLHELVYIFCTVFTLQPLFPTRSPYTLLSVLPSGLDLVPTLLNFLP